MNKDKLLAIKEKSLKELLEKDIIERHGIGKATYYTKK